jgi:hypothetical protein
MGKDFIECFITKQLLSVARTLCTCISGGFKGISFAGLNVVCIKFQFCQYWFWEGKLQDYLGFNYLANLWNFIRICRNYVVQYILDLKTAWSSTEVMVRLEGNYAFLAMQKFSSNVVEKCLKLGAEEYRSRLVRELMTSPRLGQLLQDQYANYVIQSALSVCKVCISLFLF